MANNPSSILASLSNELADLIAAAAPRVLSVSARPHRPASGIAIGGDLVITADHAVERDRDITVLADGTRHDAVLVGRDPATDIAVLRATGLATTTAPVAAIPPTGSLVISVSRTGSGTVSAGFGVITSVGGPLRTPRGVALPSIIRTDAALRPGTAGGALVDTAGQIVGMTTPGLLRGLPVAIPAGEAHRIAERLAARQPLGRGYLGVTVHEVTLAPRQQEAAPGKHGLVILGVARDGAADRAGVVVGDILLRFNGTGLEGPDDLQDRLTEAAPGATATVTVLRGSATHDLSITIGERPAA